MQRRKFLQISAGFAGLSLLHSSCKKQHKISGEIVGASSNIGHLLRDKQFEHPTKKIKIKTIIVGGGISGLSAARWLQKNEASNFLLLDLEKNVGGNSSFGTNNISSFPWGAHYVPIPNNNLKEYQEFLQEADVITNFENNIPTYNEYFLCADPQERLYINGQWQDGLVPHFGIAEKDKKELKDFLQLMQTFRNAKGKDGKDAFTIPVNNSSKDTDFTALDTLTMKAWLISKSFTSKYLHWYVNYCTRDDFGTNYDIISAWIGIHYFAARKGVATNANHSDVLTWSEGNGFLVKQLKQQFQDKILTNHLAVKVNETENGVEVLAYNTTTKELILFESEQCILATPQFVNQRLLPNLNNRNQIIQQHLQYVPWLVANLTVGKLEDRAGNAFSWDNVIYNSKSLGYVVATHQQINQFKPINNLTYYLPLTDTLPKGARKQAQQTTYDEWVNIILNDLQLVHPNIKTATTHLDVLLWGHAMAQPLPGVVNKNYRNQLQESIQNKIHFAHSDLAGISIFEEAFYQGINAAKKVEATQKVL